MDRDRLLRQLLGAQAVRLVLLDAPAGYGKTALLESWERHDPRPFHWLAGGSGARAGRAVDAAAIAAARERLAGPCVVVVDAGREGLGTHAAQRLARLAEGLPDGCVLAVAVRGAADLAVGRLRAERAVLNLGARDLALTPGEAAAALAAAGIRVGAEAHERLMALSEGWPAVLSLAAQALVAEAAPARDPDAPAADLGSHVAAYVDDEVLRPLPADLRRFALRCAILERLDAEACDAVMAEPGSAARLFALQRAAFPLARPGGGRADVRCHPAVRVALLAELRRREPDGERVLRRRASTWFAAHDDVEAAVEHALAGRDLDHAGALMWRVAQRAAWDGRRAAPERWLAALPEADVARHDGLALAAAVVAASDLDLATVERRVAVAAANVRGAGDADAASLAAGRAALLALTARGDVGELHHRAVAAAALAPPAEPTAALAALLQGTADALAGNRTAAAGALEDGARQAAAIAPGVAALCQATLALAALCDGDAEHGATLAERARARAAALGPERHRALTLVVAVSACARAQRGRFAEARADAELAARLLPERDELPPWYAAQLSLALARARLRLSDLDAARTLLTEARRATARMPEAHALQGWVADAAAVSAGAGTSAPAPAESLTAAELRVLRFLPSHLSFREIGGCLHVSANTIKSQAHAVYRKLGASSRSVAVQRAWALGLLDAASTRSPGSEDGAGLGWA